MADNKHTKTTAERIEWLRQKAAEASARAAQQQQATPAPAVQLPLWPEPVRAVPNGFLRSALFGAVARGRRRYIGSSQKTENKAR